MDEQREACAGTALGIAHHREVAVRIPESEDRPSANVQPDVLRLHIAIVEAPELAKLHESRTRTALLRPEAPPGPRTDPLPPPDALGLFRQPPDKVHGPPGDD